MTKPTAWYPGCPPLHVRGIHLGVLGVELTTDDVEVTSRLRSLTAPEILALNGSERLGRWWRAGVGEARELVGVHLDRGAGDWLWRWADGLAQRWEAEGTLVKALLGEGGSVYWRGTLSELVGLAARLTRECGVDREVLAALTTVCGWKLYRLSETPSGVERWLRAILGTNGDVLRRVRAAAALLDSWESSSEGLAAVLDEMGRLERDIQHAAPGEGVGGRGAVGRGRRVGAALECEYGSQGHGRADALTPRPTL